MNHAPSVVRYSLAAVAVLVLALGFVPSSRAASTGSQPPQFAGVDTCVACHDQVQPQQREDWHSQAIAKRPGSRNCEECHGPSTAHTEDPTSVRTQLNVTKVSAAKSAQACLRCHQTNTNNQAMWRQSEHARGNVACWDCHSQGKSPHALMIRKPDQKVCYTCHQEQRATFELTSHHPVREGRMDCADCHNPHARQTARDWEQVCASCHLKQRGPYVFPHGSQSSQLGEGCFDCHSPHGSPNKRLLKLDGRGVCLQCHADKVVHFVGRNCWTSGCHADVHGSNHSPLLLGR